jgi:hypothetical protein
LEVVRAGKDPILARNEESGTDRHISELKGLDRRSRFVGPDVNVAAVERREDPWLCCQSADNRATPPRKKKKNRTYQSGGSRCP